MIFRHTCCVAGAIHARGPRGCRALQRGLAIGYTLKNPKHFLGEDGEEALATSLILATARPSPAILKPFMVERTLRRMPTKARPHGREQDGKMLRYAAIPAETNNGHSFLCTVFFGITPKKKGACALNVVFSRMRLPYHH